MSERLEIRTRVLVDGEARGPLLVLEAPVSFWGGVHPGSGRIVDPRHPQHGVALHGQVVLVPATVGSSSSSSVLLELFRGGRAPAALLLGTVDPVLPIGAVVAEELGYATCPVLAVAPGDLAGVPSGTEVLIRPGGRVRIGT